MIQTPIDLDTLRADPGRVLHTTPSASLIDLDDGVLCIEFHSKGNTLDADVIEVAEFADRAIPGAYKGLVIGNQGKHFSFGANLKWLLSVLESIKNDRAQFRVLAKRFQRTTTGMRIKPYPTVSAPFGLTIGGGLELSMYATAMQPAADMEARLPEVAVGILPDLGGTSELYARCVEAAGAGNEAAALQQAFQIIVFMKASKNADDARRLNFLRAHDRISADRALLLNDAKARVLELAQHFTPQTHRPAIRVLGDAGYAAIEGAITAAQSAGMASEYDGEIARAIARVMTGVPGPARTVTHEEMLDWETEHFETLIWNEKTQARMKHMLEKGEPLRN